MVKVNDFLGLSKKPYSIGIAGDSASGKDAYADSLIGLFGSHSTTHLSGDDYHYWDRNEKIWDHLTHLNPKSNDLRNFFNDTKRLINGKSVIKREYNHSTGKRSKFTTLKTNNYIIISGLHTLFDERTIELFDLKIYLDIDENLRKYFKIHRDTKKRNKPKEEIELSIQNRKEDSELFIKPQKKKANLIFSLAAENSSQLENIDENNLKLKLDVTTKSMINHELLIRILIGMLNLECKYEMSDDSKEFRLSVNGNVSAESIEKASLLFFPKIREFLDVNIKWHGNSLGLMQLISLFHINENIEKEVI